jgi:hypothetical protein
MDCCDGPFQYNHFACGQEKPRIPCATENTTMARWTTFLLCAAALGCPNRWKPNDDTTGPDSSTVETGSDTQDPPLERPLFGVAEYGVIMVTDGVRIEESWGDETTYGEGYSDAYGGPTDELWPLMREHLLPQGAVAKPGYVTGITITAPAHVDLLLGKRTPYGHHPPGEGPGRYRPELPTIFEYLRAQDSSVTAEQAAFVGNTYHMLALGHSLHPGLGEDYQGIYTFMDIEGGNDIDVRPAFDPPVVEEVMSQLSTGARIVVANLHQVDRMGHYNPFQHYAYVQELDDDLTTMWNTTIQGDTRLADNTVMAIASDHGRHRFIETTDGATWRNHGCGCSGCREVPMLLLGPGVKQDHIATQPYTFEDIGLTVGWLMGVEMPYATAMVMSDMLEGDPEIPQRSGPHALHNSGDLLAYQLFRDDFSSRSEVVVDGTVFANTDAIHVEQPKVLSTDEVSYACWREVTVATDDEYWNWVPVCHYREGDGEWISFGGAVTDLVWPYFDPAMTADPGGQLYMAFSGNETGNAQSDTGVYLARWTKARGWEGAEEFVGGAFFPIHPTVVVDADYAWVAWSAGKSDPEGRDTRHVDVYRVSWPAGENQAWHHSFESEYSDASGRSFTRIDSAALSQQDGTLHLAYLAYNDDGNFLVGTSLQEPDGTWAEPRSMDTTGEVMVHVRPQWSTDGWLYWGRLGSDGDAEVCRAHTSAITDDQCESTGAPYLESVAPTEGGAWATVSHGAMQWELSTVTF